MIQIALTEPYRPVTSGAYSLVEDYVHTVEAVRTYLDHLADGGLLLVTRWLQTPPSETVRTLALLLEALQGVGVTEPAQGVIAFRGVQTGTFLVNPAGFSQAELDQVRRFCRDRRFDLVVGPGVTDDELNRYNVLAEPTYAQAFGELLTATDRNEVYSRYPFAIRPPTDQHPFFAHFFRWEQTPAVLRTLGKTWQPFGGSGIFVLLALLALALLASLLLVLAPLQINRWRQIRRRSRQVMPQAQSSGRHMRRWTFVYFSFLGLAFLLVEIPLIQQFILFLDQPVYAMTAVLFSLLLFSGLGSFSAPRLPHGAVMGALMAATAFYPLLIPQIIRWSLGLSLSGRFAVAVLCLAPLGFLMGVPFPKGIAHLERRAPRLVPWAWAVNGCTSVLSSIMAALVALSWGFVVVLAVGAAGYAAAGLTVWRSRAVD